MHKGEDLAPCAVKRPHEPAIIRRFNGAVSIA